MAFKEVGINKHITSQGVTVGLLRAGGNRLQAKVRFSDSVLEELGWKKGNRIAFLWGTDSDLGKLKLCMSETGIKIDHGRHSITACLETTRLPNGTCAEHNRSTPSEYQIDGDSTNRSLLITLPDWFYPAAE